MNEELGKGWLEKIGAKTGHENIHLQNRYHFLQIGYGQKFAERRDKGRWMPVIVYLFGAKLFSFFQNAWPAC